jgi:hypothetical protein
MFIYAIDVYDIQVTMVWWLWRGRLLSEWAYQDRAKNALFTPGALNTKILWEGGEGAT